jgi:hypothetical protein
LLIIADYWKNHLPNVPQALIERLKALLKKQRKIPSPQQLRMMHANVRHMQQRLSRNSLNLAREESRAIFSSWLNRYS